MATTRRGKKIQSTADPSQYHDVVSGIPMLKDLDDKTRHAVCDILLAATKAYTLEEGDTLYEKGAVDENTGAVLVEGSMAVEPASGNPIRVEAPELLGEMQQMSETGQRTATVTAKTKSVVLEFSWHDFVYVVNIDETLSKDQRKAVGDMLVKHAGARREELAALSGDEQEKTETPAELEMRSTPESAD